MADHDDSTGLAAFEERARKAEETSNDSAFATKRVVATADPDGPLVEEVRGEPKEE